MISPTEISTVASCWLNTTSAKHFYLARLPEASKRANSDIDLRLACGNTMTFGALYELSHELEKELGRKVDIVTNPPERMRSAFRKSIEQDEVRVYEAL